MALLRPLGFLIYFLNESVSEVKEKAIDKWNSFRGKKETMSDFYLGIMRYQGKKDVWKLY